MLHYCKGTAGALDKNHALGEHRATVCSQEIRQQASQSTPGDFCLLEKTSSQILVATSMERTNQVLLPNPRVAKLHGTAPWIRVSHLKKTPAGPLT